MSEDDKNPKTAMQEALERASKLAENPPLPALNAPEGVEFTPPGQHYESEGGEISKRKPGRPARTHSDVDNTSTNYKPSVERNNLDQALQPTGPAGGVAGKGNWEDFDEDNLPPTPQDWKPEPVVKALASLVSKEHDSPPPIEGAKDAREKMFPVRLLRNYRPATDRWYPILGNGKVGQQPAVDADGASTKINAGYLVVLPITEAKQLIKRGLAERADDLPD